MARTTSVVLAAPDRATRAGWRRALGWHAGVVVRGEACGRWDAGELVRALAPDVVVADANLLSIRDFFLTGWGPVTRDTRVVAVGPADPALAHRLLAQGAAAYVERDRCEAELAAAVAAGSAVHA